MGRASREKRDRQFYFLIGGSFSGRINDYDQIPYNYINTGWKLPVAGGRNYKVYSEKSFWRLLVKIGALCVTEAPARFIVVRKEKHRRRERANRNFVRKHHGRRR